MTDPIKETDIIKDMSIALFDKKTEEDGLLETLRSIKTAHELQVESEWVLVPGSSRSNAEVESRLSGDEEYISRLSKQTILHSEILRDQIELDFQHREFVRTNSNSEIKDVLLRIENLVDSIYMGM